MTSPIRDEWQSDDGRIRLLLGDSLEILPTFEDGSMGAVVTDPPYGIGWEYESYDDTLENWEKLILCVLPECRRLARFVIMPCCSIVRLGWWYRECPPDWIISWYQAGVPARRGMIGFNTWQALLCFGRPHVAMHDHFTTVDRPRPNGHPCPKPKGFFLWLVQRAGEFILDPFMGSGTAGVACIETGRKFVGIEIDRGYWEIAVTECKRAMKKDRSSFQFRPRLKSTPVGFFKKDR